MKILVLPGMGDIYWVATILEQFCKDNEIKSPEVSIWDFDDRKRSIDYIKRIPFVNAGGYWEHTHKVPEFDEVYMQNGRWAIPDFHGFDYLISLNGILRRGKPISRTGYKPDWFFPIMKTERENEFGEQYKQEYGDYIVVHMSQFGMFERWVKAWKIHGCVKFISKICKESKVLLTGCKWDKPFAQEIAKRTNAIDLTGQTDLDQFFGLYRNAKGCVGWCGGNTIKSVALGIPTFIVWSNYFKDPRFFINSVAPVNWYKWGIVEDIMPDQAAEQFLSMI